MKNDRELLKKRKKKFKFIAYFYIPFLFLMSLVLGSWVAKILGFKIEIKSGLFVIGVLIIVYLVTIRSFFAKVREKDTENFISSDE